MIEEGKQRRHDGMNAVLAAETAAHRTYRDTVERILAKWVRSGQEFTAETIRAEIPAGVEPRNANVLPSILGHAARNKVITVVGHVRTRRPSRHSSRISVWRRYDPPRERHTVAA